jgi:hypothetical protein
MTASQLTRPERAGMPAPTVAEMADDLLPVVGVVLQAGPPAYAIAGFAGVVALLACAPLMILAAVALVCLAVTLVVGAVAGVVVAVARLALRELRPSSRAALPPMIEHGQNAVSPRPVRAQPAPRRHRPREAGAARAAAAVRLAEGSGARPARFDVPRVPRRLPDAVERR